MNEKERNEGALKEFEEGALKEIGMDEKPIPEEEPLVHEEALMAESEDLIQTVEADGEALAITDPLPKAPSKGLLKRVKYQQAGNRHLFEVATTLPKGEGSIPSVDPDALFTAACFLAGEIHQNGSIARIIVQVVDVADGPNGRYLLPEEREAPKPPAVSRPEPAPDGM